MLLHSYKIYLINYPSSVSYPYAVLSYSSIISFMKNIIYVYFYILKQFLEFSFRCRR